MENWLEKLKPGDKVILNSGRDDQRVLRVTRTTKTQIIIRRRYVTGQEYDARFRIDNGRLVGETGYYFSYLTEATEALVAEISEKTKRSALIHSLKDFDWSKITTEDLEAVKAITDEYK